MHKENGHIHELIDIYGERPDLQEAFPEVNNGNLERLLNWASHRAYIEYPLGIGRYNHIYKLMEVYYRRHDLQEAFPEARNSLNLMKLAKWGFNYGVLEESILFPYAEKYSSMYEQDGIFSLLNRNATVLIAFSGFGHALGMDQTPYSFLESIHNMGIDILHLNDIHRAWYHFGVKDRGNNIDELVLYLREFVKSYDKVITFGNSMGGYAAILIGSIIDANYAISMVPTTFIDKKNCELFGDTRHPEFRDRVRQMTSHPEFLDLEDYFSKISPKRTQFICFYGDKNELDALHCIRMSKTDSFHIFKVKGGEHSSTDQSTAALLNRFGILEKLFKQIVDSGESKSSFHQLISLLNRESILEHITKSKLN